MGKNWGAWEWKKDVLVTGGGTAWDLGTNTSIDGGIKGGESEERHRWGEGRCEKGRG